MNRVKWQPIPFCKTLVAGTLALAMLGLTGCNTPEERIGDDDTTDTTADRRTALELDRTTAIADDLPVQGVTLNDIAANPIMYDNSMVTVSGEVNDVYGPRAFTIGGEEFFGSEVLVIGARDFPVVPNRNINEYLIQDDIIQVTGTVQAFDRVRIEREIGTVPDYIRADDWNAKPVIVAKWIYITPRNTPRTDNL